MGYIGNPFTWHHGTSVETRKAARLDRILCCSEWRLVYPAATVRHLGHAHSEHCPVLMDLLGVEATRLGERPFKFQTTWLLHAEFQSMTEREWAWQRDLMCSLKCLAEKLCSWNKDTFDNVFRCKRRLRKWLEGVVKALDVRASVGLLKL